MSKCPKTSAGSNQNDMDTDPEPKASLDTTYVSKTGPSRWLLPRPCIRTSYAAGIQNLLPRRMRDFLDHLVSKHSPWISNTLVSSHIMMPGTTQTAKWVSLLECMPNLRTFGYVPLCSLHPRNSSGAGVDDAYSMAPTEFARIDFGPNLPTQVSPGTQPSCSTRTLRLLESRISLERWVSSGMAIWACGTAGSGLGNGCATSWWTFMLIKSHGAQTMKSSVSRSRMNVRRRRGRPVPELFHQAFCWGTWRD
jgi:hypothetical protein